VIVSVKVNNMPDIKSLGVDKTGDVQAYLTSEIRRRMMRYMPYRTGTLAGKLTFVSSPTSITVNAPYARYLYYGKSASGNDLHYTTDFNPLAGPFWDETMMEHESDAIRQNVQEYIKRKGGQS